MADHRRRSSAPTPAPANNDQSPPSSSPNLTPSATPPIGNRLRASSPLRRSATPAPAPVEPQVASAVDGVVLVNDENADPRSFASFRRPTGVTPQYRFKDQSRSRSRPNPDDDLERRRANFRKRPKQRSWHTSTLEWKGKLDEAGVYDDGRVLIIDFTYREDTHKVAIAHQEINCLPKLMHFYSATKRSGSQQQPTLRVVHVQNATWAVKFLMSRYNMDSKDDLVSTGFARWAKFEKPEWRAGKPLLKGRTWRPQRDPWRGVRRTAFGVDYLRPYDVRDDGRPWRDEDGQLAAKMMELNCYDDQDGATYGYDVFVQRLSVYIQCSDGDDIEPPEGIKSPYATHDVNAWDGATQKPPGLNGFAKPKGLPLNELDNNNAIVIFEHAQNESLKDTLIGARNEVESRWRRLNLFLTRQDTPTVDRFLVESMDAVLDDIFKALSANWDAFLNIAETHVSILEDKIYDSPADESRAPELWNNSNAWLKVEKLIAIHSDVVKETINRLQDVVAVADPADEWLDDIPDEFQKISNLIQEDLVKPTAVLGDLMYKSVGIRDSRQSLQLGTSMWRLSWITFVFLPLTFMVGFFGMNVDTFADDAGGLPSIKWYFIAAVPFMSFILILWYVLKHIFARRRQTPYQRGIYEHLFHDLAVAHPLLWSRAGPRRGVRPEGFYGRLKWALLKAWFRPDKTIRRRATDPDDEQGGSGLGAWARTKRMLARRWLDGIRLSERAAYELEMGTAASASPSASSFDLATGVKTATTVALVEGEPTPHPVTRFNLSKLQPPGVESAGGNGLGAVSKRQQGSNTPSGRPSSSGGSSGYVVEEQEIPDGDGAGGRGDGSGGNSNINSNNNNGNGGDDYQYSNYYNNNNYNNNNNAAAAQWDPREVRRSIDGTLMEAWARARP